MLLAPVSPGHLLKTDPAIKKLADAPHFKVKITVLLSLGCLAMEYYSALKRREALTHTQCGWSDPTVLRKRRRCTGTRGVGSVHTKCPEQAGAQIECGFIVVRGWEGWGVPVCGGRFSFGG